MSKLALGAAKKLAKSRIEKAKSTHKGKKGGGAKGGPAASE